MALLFLSFGCPSRRHSDSPVIYHICPAGEKELGGTIEICGHGLDNPDISNVLSLCRNPGLSPIDLSGIEEYR